MTLATAAVTLACFLWTTVYIYEMTKNRIQHLVLYWDFNHLAFNAGYNGPAWHPTYNDIVMNAKLQLERPMSKDPVIPDSQTNSHQDNIYSNIIRHTQPSSQFISVQTMTLKITTVCTITLIKLCSSTAQTCALPSISQGQDQGHITQF